MICRRGEPEGEPHSCTAHSSARGRCLLAVLLLCLLQPSNSADSDCVHASWSQWTGWTPECNNASSFQQHRQRSCVLPPLDSRPCAANLCGVQNRTVTAFRTVPPTTCCQDLAWGRWSQWNPSCSDLLCNSTTLHNSTSKGPCVWMGEEEGLFSNVSGNIIVQTRRRMRDDCTAERCPECEGEEQTRVASLQVWGPWSQWSCHNRRMTRQRVCVQSAERADVYCQLCVMGIVEEEHDVQCPEPSVSPSVMAPPVGSGGRGGGLVAAVLGAIVGMLVVAVVCVLLGVLFFCLCWREIKWKQSYTLRSQPSTYPQCTSQLVSTGPLEQWTGGSREASLPLVPMQQMSGGIPPHPSAQQPSTQIHGMDVSLHSSRDDLLGESMHGGCDVSHKPRLSLLPSRAKQKLADSSEITSSQEDLLGGAHTTNEIVYANSSCGDSDNSMSWL